jgi:hypothetical protein
LNTINNQVYEFESNEKAMIFVFKMENEKKIETIEYVDHGDWYGYTCDNYVGYEESDDDFLREIIFPALGIGLDLY